MEFYLSYVHQTTLRKDSLISYMNRKYYILPRHIGKPINLIVKYYVLEIYSDTNLIAKHSLSDKKLNYLDKHYFQLVSHYAKDKPPLQK